MQDRTEQRGGMNERKKRNGTGSVYSSQYFNSSACRKIYALTNRAVIKATTIGTMIDLKRKDTNWLNET